MLRCGWTGTVLGRLQDAYPAFKEHLFAVSGVSGGALGATVFQSLLSYNARNRPGQIVNAAMGHCKGLRSIEGCAKEILGRDFLGQAFASMFFPELVQRLLPFSLQPVFADRAAALEMGWEDAWQDAMGVEDANNLMAGPFSELWQVNKRMPALFLNGTVVETARRIVASNLCIAEQRGKDRPVFREAYDFFWRRQARRSGQHGRQCRGPLPLCGAGRHDQGRRLCRRQRRPRGGHGEPVRRRQ